MHALGCLGPRYNRHATAGPPDASSGCKIRQRRTRPVGVYQCAIGQVPERGAGHVGPGPSHGMTWAKGWATVGANAVGRRLSEVRADSGHPVAPEPCSVAKGGAGVRDTAPASVLVVDDEKPLAAILRETLEREGYTVTVAYNGPDAVAAVDAHAPSLVILDVMLPSLDGFEVCETLRGRSDVPILMLTAKDTEEDKLRGFELGADDYLTKPFSVRELLARVRALLRRVPSGPEDQLRCADLDVDPQARRVTKGGLVVDLSVREFDLLLFFMRHRGQLFTREQLLSEVWGYEFVGDSARTVDVTVWRLRSKVEDDPRNPQYIQSRRGVGYLFRAQEG